MSGGWWWPGLLIEVVLFLILVMAATWFLTKWTFRHMDELVDERIHEHEAHDHRHEESE